MRNLKESHFKYFEINGFKVVFKVLFYALRLIIGTFYMVWFNSYDLTLRIYYTKLTLSSKYVNKCLLLSDSFSLIPIFTFNKLNYSISTIIFINKRHNN